jgi:hypothetical protein
MRAPIARVSSAMNEALGVATVLLPAAARAGGRVIDRFCGFGI